MTGIYLKCDECGTTIGGEDVTQKLQGIPTLTKHECNKLRELAAEQGWLYVVIGGDYCHDHDYCPSCSHKKECMNDSTENPDVVTGKEAKIDEDRDVFLGVKDGNYYIQFRNKDLITPLVLSEIDIDALLRLIFDARKDKLSAAFLWTLFDGAK